MGEFPSGGLAGKINFTQCLAMRGQAIRMALARMARRTLGTADVGDAKIRIQEFTARNGRHVFVHRGGWRSEKKHCTASDRRRNQGESREPQALRAGFKSILQATISETVFRFELSLYSPQ